MIIDFHTHLGDFRRSPDSPWIAITWETLIARLDDEGIDRAVLLPLWASPEGLFPCFVVGERLSIREQVLDAAHYVDRIAPFGNLDPRWMHSANDDFGVLLDWFQQHGCKGIGEIMANMPFDDPRVVNMFRQIGARNLPVLFHGTGFGPRTYGLQDEPGAPRLERLLQEVPETVIIGHGQGFWAELAGGLTALDKTGYPEGPVREEGALPRLMREYPNLHADISAGSGYNALSRDRDYGIRFLNEFQERILFGTDDNGEWPSRPLQQLVYLKELLVEGSISREAFDRITGGNAIRVLEGCRAVAADSSPPGFSQPPAHLRDGGSSE